MQMAIVEMFVIETLDFGFHVRRITWPFTNSSIWRKTTLSGGSMDKYFAKGHHKPTGTKVAVLVRSEVIREQHILTCCSRSIDHPHPRIGYKTGNSFAYFDFFDTAALAFAAFFLLLLIMTIAKKLPTTAEPSKVRITGIRIAHTRGGNRLWSGWSSSTKGYKGWSGWRKM